MQFVTLLLLYRVITVNYASALSVALIMKVFILFLRHARSILQTYSQWKFNANRKQLFCYCQPTMLPLATVKAYELRTADLPEKIHTSAHSFVILFCDASSWALVFVLIFLFWPRLVPLSIFWWSSQVIPKPDQREVYNRHNTHLSQITTPNWYIFNGGNYRRK